MFHLEPIEPIEPILVIRDPELIKMIAIKYFEYFADHPLFDKQDEMVSKTLVSAKGEKWKTLRQRVTPFFTANKLRVIFNLMEDTTKKFIQNLQNQESAVCYLEISEMVHRAMNDIILNSIAGVQCDSFNSPENDFVKFGLHLTQLRGFDKIKSLATKYSPTISKWFNLRSFSKESDLFFINFVEESLKLRKEQNIRRPDLIDFLLNIGDHKYHLQHDSSISSSDSFITNKDIVGQVMMFFAAGFHAISSAISFTCYELAVNMEIQEKIRREICEIVHKCSGKVSYENITKMKYLDMVASEGLRKYPPAVFLDRICTKKYKIDRSNEGKKSLVIDRGTIVWIPVVAIQHDPKYYHNPDLFDPERFSEKNKLYIHPYTYLPFGIGPRNCLASRFALLMMKVFMFYLLLDFEIDVTEKTQIPLQISREDFFVSPQNGIHLALRKIRDK